MKDEGWRAPPARSPLLPGEGLGVRASFQLLPSPARSPLLPGEGAGGEGFLLTSPFPCSLPSQAFQRWESGFQSGWPSGGTIGRRKKASRRSLETTSSSAMATAIRPIASCCQPLRDRSHRGPGPGQRSRRGPCSPRPPRRRWRPGAAPTRAAAASRTRAGRPLRSRG